MDYLKLDKVFTQGLSERGAKRTVAMQIIELAKSLDIEVIAEGAETEEHVNEAARTAFPRCKGGTSSAPWRWTSCSRRCP